MIHTQKSDGPGPETRATTNQRTTMELVTNDTVPHRQPPAIPRRAFVLAWEGRPGPLVAAGKTVNKYYAEMYRQRAELPVAA